MKIAFLIAAHAHPALVARLVERLERPFTSIHLHVDRSVDIRPFQIALAGHNVRWAPRKRSRWGTFGQVRASLSLLDSALRDDADMFMLISGQDYPLVTPERMQEFFTQHQGTSFITCRPMPWSALEGRGGFERLEHYHFALGNWRLEYPSVHLPGARRLRYLHHLCALALPRVRRLPAGVAFHAGSNWWNLTREAAQFVVEFARHERKLMRAFRFSKSADEIFFQTVLMNSGREWVRQDRDLRGVFWDGRRNEFPAVVRPEEFDELEKLDAFFIRKIHPEYSLALLDRIDRELLSAGEAR
jgi:hypothetical protein